MTRRQAHPSARHGTVGQVADTLSELAYFERACAHVIAGWSPKITELEVKTILGQHLSEDMEHADQLRRRYWAVTRLETRDASVPKGWQEVMIRIDRSGSTAELLTGLYLVVKRRLLGLCRDHLRDTDPIGDAHSIRVVRRIMEEEREQIRWARWAVKGLPRIEGLRRIRRDIERLWRRRHTREKVDGQEAIWRPLDRVPQVARPTNFRRGEPGALRIVPADPLRNPKDIGIFLHSFLNEEFATLELVSRNTYEHPDMPWQFHLDMARHAGDEARHAMILGRLAADYGVRYGDFPIYVSSYEGQYQFEPCQPGSKRELLWRMLLRQTFHEGLALDSIAFEIRKRKFLSQGELARVFEFLLTDEVFHAESGLRWSRHLCGNDARRCMEERAAAHGFFVESVKRGRARFVALSPEKAVAEVRRLEKVKRQYHTARGNRLPFQRTVNAEARKEAGFTDEEIRQVVDWGYVSFETQGAAV